MAWSAGEFEAMRDILLSWERLTPGDISTVELTLRTPGAHVGTMEGSAHCALWENLERLGWAERVGLALPPPGPNARPAFFALTAQGRDRLPAFLDHYDLRPGTYYFPRDLPPPDPARLDRALDGAALFYVGNRSYRGFTRSAAEKLRRLEMDGVEHALAAFAYDARETVAACLALAGQGNSEEAVRECAALRGRIRAHWAFTYLDLPLPEADLHDLAEPLGVGLGGELRAWLHDEPLLLARAASWLDRYGPAIEVFCDHVAARRKGAGASGTVE